MKLEQQVVSLELAQKLNELGVKQESIFYHHYTEYGDSVVLLGEGHTSIVEEGKRHEFVGFVSAFTVAELGEMLSKCHIKSSLREIEFGCYHTGTMRNFWAKEKYDSHEGETFTGDNEADARAKCLVYLLENKLITL